MKTYKGICLKDEVITDGKHSLSLKRGSEYIISTVDGNNTVTVFSIYWASGVSASLFGGLKPGPGDAHEPPNSASIGTLVHVCPLCNQGK